MKYVKSVINLNILLIRMSDSMLGIDDSDTDKLTDMVQLLNSITRAMATCQFNDHRNRVSSVFEAIRLYRHYVGKYVLSFDDVTLLRDNSNILDIIEKDVKR